MTQTFEAIYENGMLRPLEAVQLGEHERVRVIIEGLTEKPAEQPEVQASDDPLTGFRFSLGIPDFSENFNDYRLGRRKP
jgi:predicted DNA-binding antitoxin AbrB/MazE fold protein